VALGGNTMDKKIEFLKEVIERGMGIYGPEIMENMLKESGIEMDIEGNIIFKTSEPEAMKKFFDKYSSITPVAKMNLQMLAKKHKILLS